MHGGLSGDVGRLQVCQMEHQLFEAFFPASTVAGAPGLEALMDPLCTILYDALRPAFITLQPLEELCELVDILKHEVRIATAQSPPE